MSETIKVWDEIRPGDVILYDARHGTSARTEDAQSEALAGRLG